MNPSTETALVAQPPPYNGEAELIGQPADCLVFAHAPFDPRSERIRALRTELLLRREHDGAALFLALVSPGSGEGRSQLAAELALAFSKLGRPTLLVDADLRRPSQHRLFGLDRRDGLSEALTTGAAPLLRAVEHEPHLSVLTAGESASNPLELLASDRFRLLIDEWRARYAFVVFDTPAIGLYSDGLAVSTLVGQVLMLNRGQHTSYRDLRAMLRRLSATQARILGAVINQF